MKVELILAVVRQWLKRHFSKIGVLEEGAVATCGKGLAPIEASRGTRKEPSWRIMGNYQNCLTLVF
jgi:hypothetical protein